MECNRELLNALKDQLAFFESGGYGTPFRSQWRPTLLFRDSPTCVNFSSASELNPCQSCPLFPLVPRGKRKEAIPCHHIMLDSAGNSIAGVYRTGSQQNLDELFRGWLSAVIAGLELRLGLRCQPGS